MGEGDWKGGSWGSSGGEEMRGNGVMVGRGRVEVCKGEL